MSQASKGRTRLQHIQIAWAGLVMSCAVSISSAGQADHVLRIGWMSRGGPSPSDAAMDAFRKGMQELGYIEGKSFVIEPKYAQGQSDIMGQQAVELEAAGVDAIVAGPYEAAAAAKLTTKLVPIVMTPGLDPSATGVIANLTRPEGHITGITEVRPDLTPNRLQLLLKLAPGLKQVGILWHKGTLTESTVAQTLASTQQAASVSHTAVKLYQVATPADFDGTFKEMAKDKVDGLIVLTSPMFGMQRQQIVSKAANLKLPVVYEWRSYVQAGGLLSYGPDVLDIYRRAASIVDKLAKGIKPADIPVEAPTLLEMTVNLRNAKELGISIPEEWQRDASLLVK